MIDAEWVHAQAQEDWGRATALCGLDPARGVLDATAFTRNRPRLDGHGITAAFFEAVVRRALGAGLCSEEHFSVDGILIQSDASIKAFTPKQQPGLAAAAYHRVRMRKPLVAGRVIRQP
ncbi:MAG: hypothetical protein AAGC44_07605 [Planctomycetota bacterium]